MVIRSFQVLLPYIRTSLAGLVAFGALAALSGSANSAHPTGPSTSDVGKTSGESGAKRDNDAKQDGQAKNSAAASSGQNAGSKENSEPEIDYRAITQAEWKRRLTAAEFRVLRQHATEPAFTGKFHRYKKDGVYTCAGCDLPLFDSTTKFDSGTGWPSFFMPLKLENIGSEIDRTNPYEVRMEVHCERCGGHLGHVFADGPPPTGQRFCINSVSLKFVDRDKFQEQSRNQTESDEAAKLPKSVK